MRQQQCQCRRFHSMELLSHARILKSESMSDDYLQQRMLQKLGPKKEKSKRIKPLAEKRREQYKQWPVIRDRCLVEHPFCEWPGCSKRSVDAHHTEGKEGERLLDATKLKALCRKHHNWCKEKPELAEKVGMIKSRLT
jgi:hypothetical protein